MNTVFFLCASALIMHCATLRTASSQASSEQLDLYRIFPQGILLQAKGDPTGTTIIPFSFCWLQYYKIDAITRLCMFVADFASPPLPGYEELAAKKAFSNLKAVLAEATSMAILNTACEVPWQFTEEINGMTPVQIARKIRSQAAFDLLREAGATVSPDDNTIFSKPDAPLPVRPTRRRRNRRNRGATV